MLGKGETGELVIFDVTGKKVASYQLKADEHYLLINKTDLDNGIYLYRVDMNGRTVKTDKLVI